MKKYKLIIFDLDGTIVLSNNKLAKNVEKGIDHLLSQKIEVVVATGRFYDAIPDFFLNHEKIRYIVSSNGALIYDKKARKDLDLKAIDFDQALEIVKSSFDKAYNGFVVTSDGTLRERSMYERYMKKNPNYVQTFRPSRIIVEDIIEHLKNNQLIVKKIHLGFEDLEVRDELYNQFKSIKTVNTVSSGVDNIEVTTKDASKGSALHFLKEHLGLLKNQILAIGDSENDISMLKEAGLSIAMGNSTAAVQAASDFVTSDADDEGFYKAIKKVFSN